MNPSDPEVEEKAPPPSDVQSADFLELVNTSGHVQEVDRQFGFWSICAISVVNDNAWAAGTGAIVVALYNGGPPGLLYELIVACLFYFCIGAGVAELASAIPSSAGVYHWAAVTPGPKFSRIASWYAGWLNVVAWVYGVIGVAFFGAEAIVGMYALYHDDYEPKRWQIFICYAGFTWICTAVVLFGHRILARLSAAAGVLCLAFWFVTLMVVAIMPSTNGKGYASNHFVWGDWVNSTGWSSNGFVFLAGMLNGAFAIGTPDGVTHLAEEVPNPRKNIPKGIVAQLAAGFLTPFLLYIALLYGINDLNSVFDSRIVSLPLIEIYYQATGSRAAAAGLTMLFILDLLVCVPGPIITASRALWTMARDDGAPFSHYVAHIDSRFRNPFRATMIVGILCTLIGCIYIGSRAAFSSFLGCFIILSTLSYLVPLSTHIATRRRHIIPGPFYMKGWIGYAVIGTACAYIVAFDVIYMFPYALPLNLDTTMNWSCVQVGGLLILISLWYLYKRNNGYEGPNVLLEANNEVLKGIVGGHEAELAMKRGGRTEKKREGGA